MEVGRWKRIKEIFLEASEKAEPARSDFVSAACAGDSDLQNAVKRMLDADAKAGDFIEKPALNISNGSDHGGSSRSGEQLGNYRIERQIGYGGMGAVYLATRTSGGFDQTVAIKVVRQTLADPVVERQFAKERQILAKLTHPNIARLYDGGFSEHGEPFLVMEYVDGIPILRFAREHDLNIQARLRLFLKVCDAVAYAHRSLVIHRDIKPSNVLVTGTGEPKLLDFGLAKLLDDGLNLDPIVTANALHAFTPAYASPEHIRGDAVGVSSDVYSLGVMLFELLTGELPLKFKSSNLKEILEFIDSSRPRKPSSVFADASAISGSVSQDISGRAASASASARTLKGDLDTIVLKALRKDPGNRYQSVEQFADDIQRFLEGLPISARPMTIGYRTGKFIKRHKVGVLAASLIIFALVSGLGVSLWQARIARRERDLAELERNRSERINEILSKAFAFSDPAVGVNNRRDATINQMLDDLAPQVERELSDQPEMQTSLLQTVGLAYLAQNRLAEAERYLNSALQTQLATAGETQDAANIYGGLALVAESKGDLPTAENFISKAVGIYRSSPPVTEKQITDFAGILNSHGDICWTKGDSRAAETAFNESLSLAERISTQKTELIADAKRGLGIARYGQGKLDDAVVLLRGAIEFFRTDPKFRWKLPDALNFLGQALMWKSQNGDRAGLEEALQTLKESESVSMEIWGENNFWYPRSLWLQAYVMCFKGECAEAGAVLDRAEAINNRNYPNNKVLIANIYDARDLILTRSGRALEAEPMARKALEYYEASMIKGAPSITIARMHLADNLIAQKRYEEAEGILRDAVAFSTESQGPDFWRTLEAKRRLEDLRSRGSSLSKT